MKRRTFCAILPAAGALLPAAADAQPPRERLLIDHDWKFLLGDPTGAEAPSFDASSWSAVDLPHDWSIEGRIDPKSPMGGGGGYFPAGIGWYRHAFTAPAAWNGKRVSVEFEGVYMNATAWLNGQQLGARPYGYSTYFYDLTPHLRPGAGNILAVRVDQSQQPNSRWYPGAGIYRHVWLHATSPLHVAPWGVFVATPEATPSRAKVTVETRIVNQSGAESRVNLHTAVYGAVGAALAQSEAVATLRPAESLVTSQNLAVSKPALWSPESPQLYRVVTRLVHEGKTVDEVTTPFGVRTIAWSSDRGFLLNGAPVKMNGGCIHHDHGPLGVASFDRAEERRIELLKQSGFNAIRTSHNPPSPALLSACDRLGMLVMDESFDCWSRPKSKLDYNVAFKDWWKRDLEAMVLRDRNHPSVVMWSIGNEVPERGEPIGATEAKMIAEYLREFDRTRPITSALNNVPKWPDTDGFYAALDIGGYNYNLANHTEDRKRVPSRIIACTESFPRATFDDWAMNADYPYIVGNFVWTAIDYLGESGLGRATLRDASDTSREGYGAPFPCHGADCGDIDICGERRAIAHYRNIVWDRGGKLYLGVRQPVPEGKRMSVTQWGVWPVFASWTWPGWEGKPLDVEIYSRAATVRLYLDGKLIGEKPTTRAEKFTATFSVPFAPGVLKAAAVQDGKTIAETVLRTASEPAQLRLTADRAALRADGQDLSFVRVEALDANGYPHPAAEHLVAFSLKGPGILAGVGNADLRSEEPYHASQRKLFRGKALAVVRTSRAAGEITLTATAPGLKPATLTVSSAPAKA
jgi:beta-galactosidase